MRWSRPRPRWLLRMLTARLRLLPDFIIIGAQKSGTTSLYNYLLAHPCILPALTKEIHFFDNNFGRGITWYKAHFPSLLSKFYATQVQRRAFLTGEASPYYIFHPLAPERIAETVPAVKLIALLRNPVDRAYSHYHHEVRAGRETLSFEEATAREAERLNGEAAKIRQNEGYNSFNHPHYSYLSRGIYVDQLEAWAHHFPRERLLILKSEDLQADPQAILRQVLGFLELPTGEPKGYRRYHTASYPDMDARTRERLLGFFQPYNERLSEYLGVNFAWDR